MVYHHTLCVYIPKSVKTKTIYNKFFIPSGLLSGGFIKAYKITCFLPVFTIKCLCVKIQE